MQLALISFLEEFRVVFPKQAEQELFEAKHLLQPMLH
jgi:hypothetical protein